MAAFESNTRIGTPTDKATTSASIGESASITTGGLNLRANSDQTSASKLLSIALGLIGAAAVNSDSTVYADTLAYFGPVSSASNVGNKTTVNASGDVVIEANGTQFASAEGTAGGGGGFALGTVSATTNVSTDTKAFVGEQSQLTSAGSVRVSSTILGAGANAKLLAGTGGVVSIGNTKAESLSLPTVVASIGKGATVRANGGNLNVTAVGQGEADANAESSGGGVAQVGVAYANSTFTPTISATIVSGSTISASRDLNVNSELKKLGTSAVPADTIQDRTDDADNVAVDLNTDTVDFAYPLSTVQFLISQRCS